MPYEHVPGVLLGANFATLDDKTAVYPDSPFVGGMVDGRFKLGTAMDSLTGGKFVYVKFGAVCVKGDVLLIDENFNCVPVTTVLAATKTGYEVGVAYVNVTKVGVFGWVQTRGRCDVKVAASTAAAAELTASAVAGQLDDAVTVGLKVIDGVVLTAVSAAAPNYPTATPTYILAAGNISGSFKVGRTL